MSTVTVSNLPSNVNVLIAVLLANSCVVESSVYSWFTYICYIICSEIYVFCLSRPLHNIETVFCVCRPLHKIETLLCLCMPLHKIETVFCLCRPLHKIYTVFCLCRPLYKIETVFCLCRPLHKIETLLQDSLDISREI